MAPNILYIILFIVNCNECLSAEFIGQTSVPYKRIGLHFDLINSNNTSSDALRPIFPNMLLKDLKNPAVFENEHLNFVKLSKYYFLCVLSMAESPSSSVQCCNVWTWV